MANTDLIPTRKVPLDTYLLNRDLEGEGTLSYATKIIPDKKAHTIVLENWGTQRIRLTQVHLEKGTNRADLGPGQNDTGPARLTIIRLAPQYRSAWEHQSETKRNP